MRSSEALAASDRVERPRALQSLPSYRLSLICAGLTMAAAPLYVVRWHYGFYPTTLLETGIVVTVVVFLIESAVARAGLEWRTPFTLPAVIFLIAGAISVLVAPDRRQALGLYRAYIIEPVAFFFVVSAIARSARRALVLVGGLCLAALIVGIPNAYVVLHAIRHHTLDLAGTPPVVIYMTANAVALFLLPPIALAGALLVYGRDRRVRAGAGIFLLLCVPCFILTLSRGGYLALLAVVIALALTHRRRVMWVGVAAAATAVFALIPPISHRLAHELNFSQGNNTLLGRTYLWRAALQMLSHKPLTGAGLAGFTAALAPYWNATHTDRFIYPHNLILNFWTETGLLGLVAFLWLLVQGFRTSWRGWRAGLGPCAFHLGVFLALIGIVVHGMVDVPYWKNDLSLEFWVLLGLTCALSNHLQGEVAELSDSGPGHT